ncbi:MAG: type II toxin-antitoxin system RelE/ParE family toxin [Alphaproteobacteria bacterium]
MRVRYTRRALANIDRIFHFIVRENPAAAVRVVARIEGLIGQLADVPEMGEAEEMAGIRRLVAMPFPYLIFYEVAADEVIVHHIRHGARRPWAGPR